MHELLYSYRKVQRGRLTEKVLGGFSVEQNSYGKYTLGLVFF